MLQMGWLRDFMNASVPSVPSFGRLAESCLDHPQWPDDSRPKPRSLAALFSKLDHQQELDWLRERPEVQQVLADVLRRPVGDVRTAVGPGELVGHDRYLRLRDVRFARQLDLVEEDLPPGIPASVLLPPSWAPSLWLAPRGSGRSLVGHWLKARGLARVHSLHHVHDIATLPARGALYLELADDCTLTPENLDALGSDRRPLCIVSTNPECITPDDSQVHCVLLESPPVESYLAELVDWVNERLDGTGYFRAAAAEHWMRTVALPQSSVRVLGDALGLLGMLDETPPRSLSGRSLEGLAEAFVRRRLRESMGAAAVTPRMVEQGFLRLQETAARCLVTPEAELEQARGRNEWAVLFEQPSASSPPDAAWVTAALEGPLGKQISQRELERALRALPPTAHRFVRLLEQAGLLVPAEQPADQPGEPGEGSTFRLSPRWLLTVLEARAANEALRLSASDWGRALMCGKSESRILQGLVDFATRGDVAPFETLLDEFDPTAVEHVAALEGAVIALGTSLREDESFDEFLPELLARAAQTTVFLDDGPHPRAAGRQTESGFDAAHYRIALLLLSQSSSIASPRLDPDRGDASLRHRYVQDLLDLCSGGRTSLLGLPLLLQCLEKLLDGSDDRPALLRLIDGLRGTTEAPPWELLDELGPETLAKVLPAVLSVSPGLRPTQLHGRLWPAISSDRAPERWVIGRPLVRGDPLQESASKAAQRALYQAMPHGIAVARMRSGLPIAWGDMLPHQFVDLLRDAQAPALPAAAAPHCPVDAVLPALETRGPGAFDPEFLSRSMARAPLRFAILMRTWLEQDAADSLSALLLCATDSTASTLADNLPRTEDLLAHPRPTVDAVRRFLLECLHRRYPGAENFHSMLQRLEHALAPLQALPSTAGRTVSLE